MSRPKLMYKKRAWNGLYFISVGVGVSVAGCDSGELKQYYGYLLSTKQSLITLK